MSIELSCNALNKIVECACRVESSKNVSHIQCEVLIIAVQQESKFQFPLVISNPSEISSSAEILSHLKTGASVSGRISSPKRARSEM